MLINFLAAVRYFRALARVIFNTEPIVSKSSIKQPSFPFPGQDHKICQHQVGRNTEQIKGEVSQRIPYSEEDVSANPG